MIERKIKCISIIIIFLLCVAAASSKADEDFIGWRKFYGGYGLNEGYYVKQTSDGGFIITGMTYNIDFYGEGSIDVYLIRTDSDGNTQWEKTFGGDSIDIGYCVQQTSDGGFIIAGVADSDDLDLWFGIGGDVYLIKTDSGGNKQWEKTFGGNYTNIGNSIQQTSDGGYIIAGYTNFFKEDESDYDVYMIKTDSDGNMLWEKTFGGSNYDEGNSIQQSSDGGYIIAGTTESFGAGGRDAYLIKTDPNGNTLWEKTFGGSNGDGAYSVQQTSDGGYIISGWTYSHEAGSRDTYLIKTDSYGNMLWEKTFGFIGNYIDISYSVQQTFDDGYIITGYSGYGVYLIRTNSEGFPLWWKTFNGEAGYCVQQTSDGGYIITGTIYSSITSGYEVYLARTDSDGNILWEKIFGDSELDFGFSVQQTSDGGYIITGYTNSFKVYESDYDVYMIKTDSDGDELWAKTFGGKGYDYGYCIQQTSDDGYIIAGNALYGRQGISDVNLIKTDSEGNLLWEKTLGGNGYDYGYCIQQTSDGGYVIAGNTKSFGAGGWDVYLIKTNSDGNSLWEKTFGGSYDDYGFSVQQTTDRGYIIAGLTGSFGYGEDGVYDVYLIKTDLDGNTLWEKIFGASGNDYGFSVQQTSDGGYIITGRKHSNENGEADVYLIKTDSDGNTLWEKTFGGSGKDIGNSVQQTSDGGYIIAGYTESFGAGGRDVYLIKTNSDGEKLWEKTSGRNGFDEGYCVREDSDGGYVIAGYIDYYGTGGYDVYLIKTDSDGNTLWEKNFGGDGFITPEMYEL